jgi:hypothetical protein
VKKRLLGFVLVLSVVLSGWMLATPSTSVPIGTTVATGDSMGYEGPRLVVYADVDVEQGDVVVFERLEGWVVHRVIDRTEYGWQTKGDANDRPDQLTSDSPLLHESAHRSGTFATSSNVAGVVVAAVPLLDVVALLAVSTLGYAAGFVSSRGDVVDVAPVR